MKQFQSRNLKKKYELGKFADLYQSEFLTDIKSSSTKESRFSPINLDFGTLKVSVARHFGFCKGVENAIEVAYETLEMFPDKQVYMISELIHNPFVNLDLHQRGLKFIKTSNGKQLIPWEEIHSDDIVITPAFGATLEDQERLKHIGVDLKAWNATCRFVENVWLRAEELGQRGFTIIVHGKFLHEETRATFSHSRQNSPTLVVKDLKEAELLCDFILGRKDWDTFDEFFGGKYSEDFVPERDMDRLAVVNQTTMLASETAEISELLKEGMKIKFGEANIDNHFANTRDTLCYATKNNQNATEKLLEVPADFAIIVGGRNSSNTSHLVELAEEHLATYFIASEADILSQEAILHYDFRTKNEINISPYIPEKDVVHVLITSGASCPDAIVERVIKKLVSLIPGTKSNEVVMLPYRNTEEEPSS